MSISYDPKSKKWNVTKLKTDNPANRDETITDQVSITRNLPTQVRVPINYGAAYKTVWENRPKTISVNVNASREEVIQALINAGIQPSRPGYYGVGIEIDGLDELQGAQESARERNERNKYNALLNQEERKLNAENTKTNAVYDQVVGLASRTQGGDYKAIRDQIRAIDASPNLKQILEDNYKTFYRTEKLQQWDPGLGAKPQYGDFDPKYYKEQNPAVAEQWKQAVANDDIDITERYGENGYYLQHYTTQGKPAGARGNAAEIANAASKYIEKKPTDKDLQDVRNLQLGIGGLKEQTDRILKIPRVAEEWEKAKSGDPYWSKLAKEKYLNLDKEDEFAALFRLSERPEDKQVSFNFNINQGYGITELEDALTKAAGEKATVDVKRFGALAQNVLKDSIAEIKKAKQKEETLSLIGGLGGFSEIMDINKSISNSLLGESGIGGMLSFMGGGDAEKSLEKQIENITGVRNNITYNWQKWFDETIKNKYEQDLELGYTVDEATQNVKIDKAFAKEFIDKYLKPRFDESRSMDEFVEYLDVRQSEQNPFQTEDMVSALKTVGEIRSQYYLDQIKAASDRYFDSSFYFNPTGDKAREAQYAEQAKTVSEDWESAKRGDPYWQSQAYRFGVDLNDKDAFAKLHFEVKGQGKGYDGADDILNAGKVSDYIYNNILPKLKEEALKQGSVFGQFIKPAEFADELLKGVDPTNKEAWDEVLKRYGIENFKGTTEELKELIVSTLQTGSAQQIREEIKYLNEKRKKPTQELLGLTYIERPEDFKNQQEKGTTELYKVFQTAGYQGSEDEFYEKFFPDVDRQEMEALTKAGTTGKFELQKLDFSDPFASLGTIEGFFGDEEQEKDTGEEASSKPSSFFNLGLDDEEDTDYKSKSGQRILGEFTSMFKGF